MAHPSIVLENGEHGARVSFDCRACSVPLGLDPQHFNVTIGVAGVTTSPEWFCPNCGVRGSIVRGAIRITGRISIPPSGAKRASVNPGLRAAMRLERKPVEGEGEPVDAACSQRLRHPVMKRQGLPECPVCGSKDFRVSGAAVRGDTIPADESEE